MGGLAAPMPRVGALDGVAATGPESSCWRDPDGADRSDPGGRQARRRRPVWSDAAIAFRDNPDLKDAMGRAGVMRTHRAEIFNELESSPVQY